MPTMHIDSHTRLQIARAISEAMGEPKACRIINLTDGGQLLLVSRASHVSFYLVSEEDDLFDECLLLDVSELIKANLESSNDWARAS